MVIVVNATITNYYLPINGLGIEGCATLDAELRTRLWHMAALGAARRPQGGAAFVAELLARFVRSTAARASADQAGAAFATKSRACRIVLLAALALHAERLAMKSRFSVILFCWTRDTENGTLSRVPRCGRGSRCRPGIPMRRNDGCA